MFQDVAKLDWDHVRNVAMEYEPVMRQKWSRYLEEIQGSSALPKPLPSLPNLPSLSFKLSEEEPRVLKQHNRPRRRRRRRITRHPRLQRPHRNRLRPLLRRLHLFVLEN